MSNDLDLLQRWLSGGGGKSWKASSRGAFADSPAPFQSEEERTGWWFGTCE